MHAITILDPTAPASARSSQLAPRRASLDGVRVGLLHNTKPGGEVLLHSIAGRLAHDYNVKSVVWREKPLPSVPASFVQEMSEQCDLVIAALGD